MHNIYKLTFPNNKIYIGQTNNFKNRMYQYKSLTKSIGVFVKSAIIKYNWNNIKKEIIFTTTKEYINSTEQYFILIYNSNNEKFGYNLTDGGDLNYEFTDAVKKKMKKSKTLEHRKNLSKAKLGSHQSKETILKRVESKKGYKHSEKTKEKIGLTNSISLLGKKHSNEHNEKIRQSHLNKSIPIEVREKIGLANSIAVIVYTKEGKYIDEFKSLTECANELNLSTGNISAVLKNKRKSTGGYVFKFKNELFK